MINKKIHDTIIATNRTFGLLFSFVFILIGVWNYNLETALITFVCIAGFLGFVSLLCPKILYPFNLIWYGLGKTLHKVTNPLILIVLFYFVFTPLGVIKRVLRKRSDQTLGCNGQWVTRNQVLTLDELKQQF